MIAQSPEERLRYEARLKAERDQRWLMKNALDEGRDEGRKEGLVGQIQLLQKFLREPATPRGELESRTLDELFRIREDLQQRSGISVE